MEKKINAFAEIVREKLLSVLGFEPKADIHWQIEIQQPKVLDFGEFIERPTPRVPDAGDSGENN